VLRGRLRMHEGDVDAARGLFESAGELAEQAGWSEVAAAALMGLAAAQEHGGERAAARATLLEALRVCERAGLLPQSVQANARLAAAWLREGDTEAAREAASRAVEDAERVHDPAAVAAAAEAQTVLSSVG
jgi:tetratricopeptide (TPR) repeat protein